MKTIFWNFPSKTIRLLVVGLFCMVGTAQGQWGYTPELTPQIMNSYEQFCTYLLEIQLSPTQQQELQKFVRGYWQQNKQQNIQNVMSCVEQYEQLQQVSAAERVMFREVAQPLVLADMQQYAQKGEKDSEWLLNVYYSQHPKLCPGNPPLTRDILDNLFDFQHFFQNEVLGQNIPQMDVKTRQAAYQSAIAEYQRMTAEQQLDLASKSGKTHHFRHQWAQMTPAERAYTKMNAGGQLTAQEKQQVAMLQQQIAQMGSQNNMQLLQNEINHMRQNQQTIMGSGPRWNQTLGRWEQVGGIVTDFY